MKLAVLILLIANLVLFVWLRWMAPGPQAELQPIAPAGKRLELVSPLSAAPAASVALAKVAVTQLAPNSATVPAAPNSTTAITATTVATAPTQAVAAPAPQTLRCLVWGPLPATVDATAFVARLGEHGGKAMTYARQVSVTATYRVELGGFANAAAAEKAAKTIRRGGVKDLFLLKTDDGTPPTLSLGVFRDRVHAGHRAARVRALGFKPRIAAIQESRTQRYMRMQAPLAASVAAALKTAGITSEPRHVACAETPPAGTSP